MMETLANYLGEFQIKTMDEPLVECLEESLEDFFGDGISKEFLEEPPKEFLF